MEITLQRNRGVPFYACTDPAWAGAAHGFSTKLGGVSPAPWDSLNLGANRGDDRANVQENFRRFCAALGTDPDALVKNHQVHSAKIRPVTLDDTMDDPAAPGQVEADGLVTDQSGVCLTIFSGDCIPILLYDPVRRCIAAAHAGWRGTASGIAAQAVTTMVRQYGCDPKNILAAIGPGIGPCCFETHADVPDGLRAGLGELAAPMIHPIPGREKFRVDLKGANAIWLEQAGLTAPHIAICPACTACQLDIFWSHRIQGASRGSMAAMIQLL
jgi:hypothetical protein